MAAIALTACTDNKDYELRMLVGTYTDTGSHGIYSLAFNQATGYFEMLDSCCLVNPSYLTVDTTGSRVYAVTETSDSTAALSALAFDKIPGSFTLLNSQPTVGTDPCYVATNGHVAVTANYGGSMSVFPLAPDGSLAPLSQLVEGSTGGPDTLRQIKPHVHCTEFSPDGTQLMASDFSADRLLLFPVDGNGLVVTDSTRTMAIDVEPDTGPRHIVFDASGRFAYMLGELSGRVSVLEKEADGYAVVQVIEADPLHGRASGDIHLSPDGQFLYASVRRANDGIAIFKVNPSNGLLTAVGYQTTGLHPRNFAITPNGSYLLCACRDSNSIEIFKRDAHTGLLASTGRTIDLPKPVCIKFVNIQNE